MTKETYSYDSPGGRHSGGRTSVLWSAFSLGAKQILLILFSFALARILGPQSYGVISQATIYISFTTLLLDQGISEALISARTISRDAVKAAGSVNLLLSIAVALVSLLLARPIASFFHTPELALVLVVLSCGLILKALAIVPRMLLSRSLRFRAIAVSEIAGALLGGTFALVSAFVGWDYWSLVTQTIVMDTVTAIILMSLARPPLPGFRFSALRDFLGFSARVFLGNLLSFSTRNVDNIAIGRAFDAGALALYSVSYRVLLMPVQIIGQGVSRAVLPALSRRSTEEGAGREVLLRCLSSIAVVAFPLMGFIGVASADWISVILGDAWLGAAPVVMILAVTGARQSVTALAAPLMLAYSKPSWHLRFNLLAGVVQVAGILIGLFWGIVGVAWGYTIAGVVLTPVVMWIYRSLTGTTFRRQLTTLAPATVATVAAIAAYIALGAVGLATWGTLVLGAILGAAVFAAVVRWGFPKYCFGIKTELAQILKGLRGGRNSVRSGEGE